MHKEDKTLNLLSDKWVNIEQHELMFILENYIGGPGQYYGRINNPNKFYLPLAESLCKIILTYKGKKLISIEPGPAFDSNEWKRVSNELNSLFHTKNIKTGREYSFSSFRVFGGWQGERSKVQILPPPDDAPRTSIEMADHPFILEFPVIVSNKPSITNYRRQVQHRKLTFLLNILLAGRTSLQPRRPESFWANVSDDFNNLKYKWVQQSFFAKLGNAVIDELSSMPIERLEEVEPEEYYTKVGHDGMGLRVPNDLDESICHYLQLSQKDRLKFDRATFWMDMASRQWSISVSASFAALVSAIESLTERGKTHRIFCDDCKDYFQHETPGATERFRSFLEKNAPGTALKARRSEMYSLRSGILHGSDLMELDQYISFGWSPPKWNEYELHNELWGITRFALRNWLKNPS